MKPDLKIIQPKPIDPGDPQFFEQAYKEYFSSVFNYIRYRVTCSTLADDLTSISFHKALEKMPKFDPVRASFSTWLFVIARNTVNDHLRKSRRRKLLSVDWLVNRADGHIGADELLIGEEERHRLVAAIATLSQKERDILGLKFAAGKTNRAIAVIVGQSESNVGVIVHRSVEKLRIQLGTEEASK